MDWYTRLDTFIPNTPSYANHNDLYAVILHEALHLMGFYSLESLNANFNLVPGVYSRYDAFLTDSVGTALISISDSCYNTVYQSSLNGQSGCGTIFFNGQYNTSQEIHSPTQFSGASAFSHFGCFNPQNACPTAWTRAFGGQVMTSCTGTGSGWDIRKPSQAEMNTLCDLGYKITGTYGTSTLLSNGLPNPAFDSTYTICSGFCEIPITVNDLALVGGTYTAFTISSINVSRTISASRLLDNDFGATSGARMHGQVSCLEIITPNAGTATMHANGQGFDFVANPGFSGDVFVRYRAEDTSTVGRCRRGNWAYVFLYVEPVVPTCTCSGSPPCDNLVCGGDLESIVDPYGGICDPWQLITQKTPLFGED